MSSHAIPVDLADTDSNNWPPVLFTSQGSYADIARTSSQQATQEEHQEIDNKSYFSCSTSRDSILATAGDDHPPIARPPTPTPPAVVWPLKEEKASVLSWAEHQFNHSIPWFPAASTSLTPAQGIIFELNKKINSCLESNKQQFSVKIFIHLNKDGSYLFSHTPFNTDKDALQLILYIRPVEINSIKKLVSSNLAFLYLKAKLTELYLNDSCPMIQGLPTLCTLYLPPIQFPSLNGRNFESLFFKFFLDKMAPPRLDRNTFEPYLQQLRQQSFFHRDPLLQSNRLMLDSLTGLL